MERFLQRMLHELPQCYLGLGLHLTTPLDVITLRLWLVVSHKFRCVFASSGSVILEVSLHFASM